MNTQQMMHAPALKPGEVWTNTAPLGSPPDWRVTVEQPTTGELFADEPLQLNGRPTP